AEALLGAPIGEAGAREAARIAAEDAEPIDDLRGSAWYKRRIVRVLVERAVRRAAERAAA
ncbi:MAG: xanthine dehydrogenase family protein subunit M, partial [Chloroflexota bacterium]|nr:xanthine dehydrogenase family protein subunit M [Chloroflexota bacterium]